MATILNEDDFQKWVMARFTALGAHIQDFSAAGGNVPDLSIGLAMAEYWLELKFARFRLLHKGYDDFKFDTLTRGQLDWLQARNRRSGSLCGVLGYFQTVGDGNSGGEYPSTDYLFFMTADRYLDKVWMKKVNSGSMCLSHHAAAAHSIQTGTALLGFLDEARRDAPHNDA